MGFVTYFFVLLVVSIAIVTQFYSAELYEILGNGIDKYGNQLLIAGYLPDALIRFGVTVGLNQRLNELEHEANSINSFVMDLKEQPLTAQATKLANDQHYEVDTSFYQFILGFYKKYSSTIYLSETEKKQKIYDQKPSISLQTAYNLLNESEVDMLSLYMERADLCIGNDCKLNVLDLGCGWGSFSLFYASKCPNCKITSISNSESQILYINNKAKEYGFKNVKAIRQNVNNLNELTKRKDINKFDRIISIEMFEHMKNYKILLSNLNNLISCNGKLFVHMFVHKNKPYHFESGWMAQHFFTGGTMATHKMLGLFHDDFKLKESWIINGVQYSYTLETWLFLMDKNEDLVKNAIADIYGNDKENVVKWWYLWRTFFIACSELFKYNDGNEWFVGHYLLTPKC